MKQTPIEIAHDLARTTLSLPFYKQVIFQEERNGAGAEILERRYNELVDILSARLQFIAQYGFKSESA